MIRSLWHSLQAPAPIWWFVFGGLMDAGVRIAQLVMVARANAKFLQKQTPAASDEQSAWIGEERRKSTDLLNWTFRETPGPHYRVRSGDKP